MVTINLTLLIELMLFLTFMWAMGKYVFRPLLLIMDQREERLEEDREKKNIESGRAKELELEYTKEVGAIHRKASEEINLQHRKEQGKHNDRIIAFQAEAQKELQNIRANAQAQIETERQKFPALTADLDQQITSRLGLEEE